MIVRKPAWIALLASMALFVAPAGLRAAAADRPAAPNQSPPSHRLALAEGWDLQTSAKVTQSGEQLSQPAFTPQGWMNVTVPTTWSRRRSS